MTRAARRMLLVLFLASFTAPETLQVLLLGSLVYWWVQAIRTPAFMRARESAERLEQLVLHRKAVREVAR